MVAFLFQPQCVNKKSSGKKTKNCYVTFISCILQVTRSINEMLTKHTDANNNLKIASLPHTCFQRDMAPQGIFYKEIGWTATKVTCLIKIPRKPFWYIPSLKGAKEKLFEDHTR